MPHPLALGMTEIAVRPDSTKRAATARPVPVKARGAGVKLININKALIINMRQKVRGPPATFAAFRAPPGSRVCDLVAVDPCVARYPVDVPAEV